MCMMMADTMDALGLAGKYVVKVNNRKVLDGVLEAAGVEHEEQKLTALRAFDKFDKIGLEGVRSLLGAGRRDISGDFTQGARLASSQIELLMTYFMVESVVDEPLSRQNAALIGGLANIFDESPAILKGLEDLERMVKLFEASGYNDGRVRVDTSVVRGLEYYTGPVFEIELTFQVPNEKGQPVVFGSVGGGGRYDGLVSRFRKDPVPATGFSIGVSRLATALRLTGNLATDQLTGPVVVLVLDRDPAAIADYQKMTSELRRAGIRAEMYLGASGMNAQMKYADRRNAAATVIVGSNERAEGKVTIKDLAAGAAAAKAIENRADYVAERPGQWTANRADLVAELSRIPSVARMRGLG
jgi:histidyl-tRNA synthetase